MQDKSGAGLSQVSHASLAKLDLLARLKEQTRQCRLELDNTPHDEVQHRTKSSAPKHAFEQHILGQQCLAEIDLMDLFA